jgi:hypothetical protein
MAKNKVSEWSATPANNTDIANIDIAEGCAPSGINNAIREIMAQVKDMQSGADGDSFNVGGDLYVADDTTIAGTVIIGESLTTTGFIVATSGFSGNLTGNVTGNVSGTSANVTGTVAVANGGTGLTTLTANNVMLGNGASTPTFVAPGTSGNVLTSNGTTWTSATPAPSIGVGQTWQNVLGSRSSGVNYTNSTGKPIMVAVGIASTNGFISLTSVVDNVQVGTTQAASPTSTSGGSSYSFIVPAGSTYRVTINGSFTHWAELR